MAVTRRVVRRRALKAAVRRDRDPGQELDVGRSPGDCPRLHGDAGPCPYVSCRHHLYGDVTELGSLRVYHPGVDVWDLQHTCSIDLAIAGPLSTCRIGDIVGLGERAVRYVVREALGHFLEGMARQELARLGASAIDAWAEHRRPRTTVDGAEHDLCLCRQEGEVLRCDPARLLAAWAELDGGCGEDEAWLVAERKS